MADESSDLDEKVQRTCSILERIAAGYAAKSEEAQAIEEAAHAFQFLALHDGLRAAFAKHRDQCGLPLTDDQKNVLRRMGIADV